MITDDAISMILGKTEAEMTGIDQVALRRILDEVFLRYDISLKEGMDSASDVPEKIRKYLDTLRIDGLSEKTIKNYEYHLIRFSQYVKKPIGHITVADLRSYLANLVSTRKIKNSTLEGEKSILKSFFLWLEIEEYIVKSPAKKIKPTKVERRVRHGLSIEELELMRDACATPRQRCMLELFFCTGMRLDELSNVDIDDLNWTDNSIRIIGKGNAERIVFFSAKAKVYIKKYLAVRGFTESSALFITSKLPKARMGHRSIQNEIKTIAIKAGIDRSVFPHLLRHSFASIGLNSGMSINTIQELMGHSKIDTTMIYARMDRENAKFEYKKYLNQ